MEALRLLKHVDVHLSAHMHSTSSIAHCRSDSTQLVSDKMRDGRNSDLERTHMPDADHVTQCLLAACVTPLRFCNSLGTTGLEI